MRSPGDISDAPRDCPIVPFSCMRLPGLFSEAPGAVVVVESCISCPGLYCEAPGDAVPLLVVVCATANEAVPRSNAVAMAIVFDILISLGWSPGGNRGTLASFRLSELSISPPSAGQNRGLTAALTESDACALFASRQPHAAGRLRRGAALAPDAEQSKRGRRRVQDDRFGFRCPSSDARRLAMASLTMTIAVSDRDNGKIDPA
jgi:hypothetical protein